MKIKLIDYPLKTPSQSQLKDNLKKLSKELKLYGICSVIFTNDAFLRRLHKTYLNVDAYTDVITFNLGDTETEGEIYISKERALEQAKQYNSSFSSEIIRYIIHGFLHLAGYNDKSEQDYTLMKNLEDKYLELYFNLLLK